MERSSSCGVMPIRLTHLSLAFQYGIEVMALTDRMKPVSLAIMMLGWLSSIRRISVVPEPIDPTTKIGLAILASSLTAQLLAAPPGPPRCQPSNGGMSKAS